jgi:hypothetical protein
MRLLFHPLNTGAIAPKNRFMIKAKTAPPKQYGKHTPAASRPSLRI